MKIKTIAHKNKNLIFYFKNIYFYQQVNITLMKV